jgi:hypothetical protein
MPLTGAVARGLLRGLKWTMYAVWALAGLCLLFYAGGWAYFTYVELPALDRFLADASAVNGRDDVVAAATERDGDGAQAAKTVITLKRAHAWFATPLLVAHSKDYLVGFKWQGDDRLVLILDFGCAAQLSDPVRRVGPVEILYRFDRAVILPAHGYSSFPREGPRPPCHTRRDLTR